MVVEKMVMVMGKCGDGDEKDGGGKDDDGDGHEDNPKDLPFQNDPTPPGRGWLIEGWQQMPWYPPGVTNIR